MTIITMWHDVRDAAGKLLFRFDPQRDLVQVKRAGVLVVIDLSQYRPQPPPAKKAIDIAKRS
jgi:hypothetical protein